MEAEPQAPGWDALLATVAAREVTHIVCYDPDRLMRQPRDLEDLLDAADQGIEVVGQVGGFDLRDANARFYLRMLVNQACKASDDTSRRVRTAQAERVEAGLHHGSPARSASRATA